MCVVPHTPSHKKDTDCDRAYSRTDTNTPDTRQETLTTTENSCQERVCRYRISELCLDSLQTLWHSRMAGVLWRTPSGPEYQVQPVKLSVLSHSHLYSHCLTYIILLSKKVAVANVHTLTFGGMILGEERGLGYVLISAHHTH